MRVDKLKAQNSKLKESLKLQVPMARSRRLVSPDLANAWEFFVRCDLEFFLSCVGCSAPSRHLILP